ncbi:hypothetical protein JHK82_031718 [Glycine max]|nr:hypothetical protein JHK82_031718 [Glycine max]
MPTPRVTRMQVYCACAAHASGNRQKCNIYLQYTLQCRGYHPRHQTIHVHAWGLDRLITLLLVKATNPNIRQSPSTWDNLLRHWTTSFACKSAQSLGGLCTIQIPLNTCALQRDTLRHTSTLHANLAQEHRCPALYLLAGPPSCSLNKGNSMSNVQSTRAHLSHIQSDVCQLRILKPPSYRDPNSKPLPPPPRKPMLTPSFQPKPKRRSCCRICCYTSTMTPPSRSSTSTPSVSPNSTSSEFHLFFLPSSSRFKASAKSSITPGF